MMRLLLDIPVAVVFLHLAALVVLLLHIGVIQLRRFILIRQSRNPPSTAWFRLLHLLLGLPE
jgi:hypothetical protein